MIDGFLDTIAKAASLPVPVLAMAAGTLLAFGLTQRLKFLIPKTWSKASREVTVQALAFAVGFGSTYFLWGTATTGAFIGALLVGLWSPALWNVLMLVLGWWKPGLREVLSQDVRTTR